MTVDQDLLVISQSLSKDITAKTEQALLVWLGVKTVEDAIEKIEDLRCQGFGIEVLREDPSYRVSGPKTNIKYSATWTVRFKVISLRED